MGFVESETLLSRFWNVLAPVRAKRIPKIGSFEKGLAVRGGCREEILPMPEIEASFLCLFAYAAPLGEGGHIAGELFGLFLGVCLSPTPSRQPLFETSDKTCSGL